jgi:hypothetical protein
MTFKEFQDSIQNLYMNIWKEIQNYKDNEKPIYKPENFFLDEKAIVKKISGFVEELPDVMSFPEKNFSLDQKFNNIIYYNQNKDHIGTVKADCDFIENHTSGAFIFCDNENSLDLVIKEILMAFKNNHFIKFNIITNGRSCEKLKKILDNKQEFNNCITKKCIYCSQVNKYESFKEDYKILHDPKSLKNDFIEKLSSKEIKPFPLVKLITFENYKHKYKERHRKISQFYGKISPESYKIYISKLKSINEMHDFGKGFIKDLTLDLNQDLDKLNELIIKNYSYIHLYKPLNKMLLSSDFYEAIAYFTAIIMYSLNSYAKKNKKFCTQNNKKLYRGITLPYTFLLQYERAKGKAICFSSFTSTSESEEIAKGFAGRNNAKDPYDLNSVFSVVFTINHSYKNGYISNAIDISELSDYKDEKEYIFQPFSFFYLKDIHIDIINKTADIILDTIGKKEIIEEKIKAGKEIKIDEKTLMIEIK